MKQNTIMWHGLWWITAAAGAGMMHEGGDEGARAVGFLLVVVGSIGILVLTQIIKARMRREGKKPSWNPLVP